MNPLIHNLDSKVIRCDQIRWEREREREREREKGKGAREGDRERGKGKKVRTIVGEGGGR